MVCLVVSPLLYLRAKIQRLSRMKKEKLNQITFGLWNIDDLASTSLGLNTWFPVMLLGINLLFQS